MDTKLLSANNWKTAAPKLKVPKGRDNDGLLKALLFFEKVPQEKIDERSGALKDVLECALALKALKEVAASRDAVKYLTDLGNAAQAGQRELTRTKVEAEKAEALADKAAAANQKKAEADAKKQGQEEEGGGEEEDDEEEEGDTYKKLTTALKTLKVSKKPYYFLVCDAKPYGLIISRKDIRKNAQAKKELTKVAGGSTRAPKFGECHFDGSKYIFEMEKPPSGLARILQKWIKQSTGLGLKVMVGTESAEDEGEGDQPGAPSTGHSAGAASSNRPAGAAAGAPANGPLSLTASVGRGGKNKPEDVTLVQTALNKRANAGLTVNGKCDSATQKAIEEFQKRLGKFKPDGLIEPSRGTARALAATGALPPPPEPPKPIAPPKLEKPTLEKAPVVWRGTRGILDNNIKELKKAIRQEYADEHPEVLKEIDNRMSRLDVVLEKLDHRLADSLANAYATADAAGRKAEMAKAKAILTDYIKYVKTEPMIDHMDSNPFGVKTNLRKVLMDSLTHVAQVIH